MRPLEYTTGEPQAEPDFPRLRAEMVAQQLVPRGIRDPRVLAAMASVPREKFVPPDLGWQAYDDSPLPIGFGQTISQPLTVAWMLQELQLCGTERVLDVGTGSGYAAAVLSRLCREVHSVEIIPELARRATQVLAELGYLNVHVHLGDGSVGLPQFAPYDAIIVAAGGPALPPEYLEQGSDQARILIPIGHPFGHQEMTRFSRHEGEWLREDLGPFAFVPLRGARGWPTSP